MALRILEGSAKLCSIGLQSRSASVVGGSGPSGLLCSGPLLSQITSPVFTELRGLRQGLSKAAHVDLHVMSTSELETQTQQPETLPRRNLQVERGPFETTVIVMGPSPSFQVHLGEGSVAAKREF